MPLAEALPNGPALAVNQGRNKETSRTTEAAPAIRSAWESRAASKLNPCIAAPGLLAGGVLAGEAPAWEAPAWEVLAAEVLAAEVLGREASAGKVLGGGALAGLAGPRPAGAPHLPQAADPSGTWPPHCPQNIPCLLN
jgi:hypothetical protein